MHNKPSRVEFQKDTFNSGSKNCFRKDDGMTTDAEQIDSLQRFCTHMVYFDIKQLMWPSTDAVFVMEVNETHNDEKYFLF